MWYLIDMHLLAPILILCLAGLQATVHKYLVLGITDEVHLQSFLSAMILDEGADSDKISFIQHRDHAILGLAIPNLLSTDAVELFFIRDSKTLSPSVLVKIIRWLDYWRVTGIILLDQDIIASEATMMQLLVPASANNVLYFSASKQKKHLLVNDAEYSWSKTFPSQSQVNSIRNKICASKSFPLIDINTNKNISRHFAVETLAVKQVNSMALHRRFFDFFMGLLFPVDLLSFAIQRGHLDIISYLLKPLAPSYIDALAGQFDNLAQMASLLFEPVTEDVFRQTYQALGFAPLLANSSLSRYRKYCELAPENSKQNVVLSLLPEADTEFPIFEALIADKQKAGPSSLLIDLMSRYLHWSVVAEIESNDERAHVHLKESMLALHDFMKSHDINLSRA